MKPTREEILTLALIADENDDFDLNYEPLALFLERFAIAMYRRGAEDMRERAANACEEADLDDNYYAPEYVAIIRALPIGD